MKTKKKQGVSLMVLVITIIVMVVLAGTVIVSLNNSGIIGRTQGAVNEYNLKQVEELANVAWGEAFVKGNRTEDELKEYVINDLVRDGINLRNYNIEVTTKGVTVTALDGKTPTTIGALIINALDYGKTVNYEANGVTGWKVFYKQTVAGEEYVYLITSDVIPGSAIPTNIPNTIVDARRLEWDEENLPEKAATIENKELWVAEWGNYDESIHARCVSQILSEQYWTAFKNTKYGENVVGAIGAPTLEMFVKSYNERSRALEDASENSILTLTTVGSGYKINNEDDILISRHGDNLYSADSWHCLAAPSDYPGYTIYYISKQDNTSDHLGYSWIFNGTSLRPLVCLKASTPARLGTTSDSTEIVLE